MHPLFVPSTVSLLFFFFLSLLNFAIDLLICSYFKELALKFC